MGLVNPKVGEDAAKFPSLDMNLLLVSFNARLRDECLNINNFYSLLHAQVVINDWKLQYNHDRRHSSLGYLEPVDYAQTCTHKTTN